MQHNTGTNATAMQRLATPEHLSSRRESAQSGKAICGAKMINLNLDLKDVLVVVTIIIVIAMFVSGMRHRKSAKLQFDIPKSDSFNHGQRRRNTTHSEGRTN